jgi:hypothetical protein
MVAIAVAKKLRLTVEAVVHNGNPYTFARHASRPHVGDIDAVLMNVVICDMPLLVKEGVDD